MKTILVPVDFSLGSKNALLFALEVAQKAKLKVVVFHAFYAASAPPAMYEIPLFLPELEKEKCRELDQFVASCKADAPNDYVYDFKCVAKAGQHVNQVPGYAEQVFHTILATHAPKERYTARVTCVAKMGKVQDQIVSIAGAYEADLVIMGMQGGGSLGKAIIGSTTVSVMRNSRVPVLGVPLWARFRSLSSVIFASDLSRQPDNELLRLLRDFMKTFRPRLEVLHLHRHPDMQIAYKNIERALESFDEQLHDVDYKVVLRQRTDVVAGIREYVQEKQASILILSPQKHTFLERLLNKSVTAQMVAYNEVPLLTLPSFGTGWQVREPEELEVTDNQAY
ncbi:universal stress protein [Pontibacter qinzhouensis]|uniref:Universal stress protein n=1 Tax=Pontibacter qinzhouensis TaxID=2603253 RepID=A0A5C8JHI5_9BACT|nr:universal stress protein [Pontibacter qinzhouensis]TXK36862.1 universal stress protein [Pontibacter qinzhouensis]